MPDAAKAAIAGDHFRFENGARAVAEQQIGVADDAGADRGGTVTAARGYRRNAIGKLDFADRAERFRAARAIHRAGLDIDGCNKIMAGGDIVDHLLDQVTLAAAIPQMMMGIDDRTLRSAHLLFSQRKPVRTWIGIQSALRSCGVVGG